MIDSLLVCVRIFKSGSQSLTRLLADAFADRRTFYLPTLLDLDGRVTRFQRLRFQRTRARNLFMRYRSTHLNGVIARIRAEARDGDLIDGGHIPFAPLAKEIARPLKMIFIQRDPVARALSEYNYGRESQRRKNPLSRLDAGLLHKIALRRNFEGYLDFQLEHADVYGDVACRFVGWDGAEDLRGHFERNVFHAGTLEDNEVFAARLSEKLGKPLAFPHRNRTDKADETTVSAAARAKIERLYARDFALYEWVRTNAL